MMLDGTLCEGCGEMLPDQASPGYPRKCRACRSNDEPNRFRVRTNKKNAAKIVQCDRGCRKWFVSNAARDQHAADKHPVQHDNAND